MAEHKPGWNGDRVSCDGTGYGPERHGLGRRNPGGGRPRVERAAHLACVPMPGSAAAIRSPGAWPVSYLQDAFWRESGRPGAARCCGRPVPTRCS